MSKRDIELGAKLIEAGAAWAHVTEEELLSRVRKVRLVLARQGIMYVLRANHGWTLHEVADLLRRDHSTVSDGTARFKGFLHTNTDALELSILLRGVAPGNNLTDEMRSLHMMAQAVLDLTTATREAMERMELIARRTLRMTEDYK